MKTENLENSIRDQKSKSSFQSVIQDLSITVKNLGRNLGKKIPLMLEHHEKYVQEKLGDHITSLIHDAGNIFRYGTAKRLEHLVLEGKELKNIGLINLLSDKKLHVLEDEEKIQALIKQLEESEKHLNLYRWKCSHKGNKVTITQIQPKGGGSRKFLQEMTRLIAKKLDLKENSAENRKIVATYLFPSIPSPYRSRARRGPNYEISKGLDSICSKRNPRRQTGKSLKGRIKRSK